MANIVTYKGGRLHRGQIAIRDGIFKAKNKISIVNASRQSGKSFLLVQLLLFFAINEKNTILVVSAFNSQNLKILDEICYYLDLQSKLIVKKNRTDKQIVLVNGTIINFRSAESPDAIRGGSYNIVFCDEMAFYKKNVWKSVIAPTMVSRIGSRAFLFSTPRGKNEFYDICMRGKSSKEEDKEYAYYFMSYKDNPFSDLEYIKDCKDNYPEALFNQEFEGEFVDGASVFELNGCDVIEEWLQPIEGMNYYAGLDLANKIDKTVLTILDEDGNTVFIRAINKTKWQNIVSIILEDLRRYNDAYCVVEVNNIGDVVYDLLEAEYYNISPIYSSNQSKQIYIEELIGSINELSILLPTDTLCPDLHSELDTFELSFSPKTRRIVYAARQGFHDDHVISLAIANHNYRSNKGISGGGGGCNVYFNGQQIT